MSDLDSNIAKIIISPESAILDAIRVIDAGGAQIALVADEQRRLIGTLTDGDVRRALLRGVRLEEPVRSVCNTHPSSGSVGMSKDAMTLIMREKGIDQLPILDAERRIVGLELLDDLLLAQGDKTWIVLMVGGLGQRLQPITNSIPKPLLPVGGKPILQSIVETFASQGFRHFFFAVNYRAKDFIDHFGNGEQFGVHVNYLHETERKGTAGALSLLEGTPPGPIIVMNGDIVTNIDFRHLLRFHEEQKAVATMCVREYSVQVPFGVAEIEQQSLVAIHEKPVHNFFVNAGIYVLSPEALREVPSDRFYDMPELFSGLIAKNKKAAVFPMREYWLDIGRHEDLERARHDAEQRDDGDKR